MHYKGRETLFFLFFIGFQHDQFLNSLSSLVNLLHTSRLTILLEGNSIVSTFFYGITVSIKIGNNEP